MNMKTYQKCSKNNDLTGCLPRDKIYQANDEVRARGV